MSKEWTAKQYDEFYKVSEEYRKPYQESIYWSVWQEVLRRIPKNVNVVEFGCGTGQFGRALSDRGINAYIGFDFSAEAIWIANELHGQHIVCKCRDISKPLPRYNYDYLICLETLEHIEDDIGVLNRIRPGKRCLITVPNYGGPNHVRYFESVEEVLSRYGEFFCTYNLSRTKVGLNRPLVLPIDLNDTQTIYLLDGVRNERN